MVKKTWKGVYTPKNPEKYIGDNINNIQYRSNWELQVMLFFDDHPNCIGWGSEVITIPYKNPLTGKMSRYVPDFLVIYVDRNNEKHVELIEIKPAKESPLYEGRVNRVTKLYQAINAAKWMAASKFCAQKGWKFKVMTERELFGSKV